MKFLYFSIFWVGSFFSEYKNPDYLRPFYPYYSQAGQDKYLDKTIFASKKGGVFFDIGAHDGISYSNTYFFEKKGWSGICVEPQQEKFDLLEKNRSCLCLKGGIYDRSGEFEFIKVNGPSEMLTGIKETYVERHFARVVKEIRERGGDIEIIKKMCFNFNEVCKQHNITYIDLLSIDTEGSEEKILKSIDFKNIDIDVIVVENNYQSKNINIFLEKKGYKFITIVGDEIYRKIRN